ncbi:MAG: GTP cyclohydrolase I FolE [Oligoflexus sp.]
MKEELTSEDKAGLQRRPLRSDELRRRLNVSSLDAGIDSEVQRYEMATEAARRILKLTDEDLSREGLLSTPSRFAKAYDFLFKGYHESVSSVVGEGVFPSEGQGLVSVENVEFYSMCEHHLLPFWGQATVAYFPGEKILGLSKIPRLVDLFARRVQVQERITEQVCAAIDELIQPRAILVKLEAQHLCMMMRGVEKQTSRTKTQVMRHFANLEDYEKQQFVKLMN